MSELDFSKSYHVFLLLHFLVADAVLVAALTDLAVLFTIGATARVLEAVDEAPPVNNMLTPASTVSAVPLDIPVDCNP